MRTAQRRGVDVSDVERSLDQPMTRRRPDRIPRSALAVGIASAAALALLVRRRLLMVRVIGRSMSPTFAPGDHIVAVRTRRVQTGDVVVFRLPSSAHALVEPSERDRLAVKRVAAVAGETVQRDGRPVASGQIHVRGDAPRSLDSTVYGTVPLTHVVARAVPRRGPRGPREVTSLRRPDEAHAASRVPM